MKVIIVGGGVGGLTLALMLHRRGLRCEVFEAVPTLRPLGVGINVLPHAVRELTVLELLPKLDAIAVRTRELTYANRFGQEIWRELRGLDAGLDAPQFSIHRGFLQNALFEAVVTRLGPAAVTLDRRLLRYQQDEAGVVAEFATSNGDRIQVSGDILIGCDGIHSCARALLYPDEGGLRWNGVMMWRGAAPHAPLGDGRSMIVAGGFSHKLVLYPIGPIAADGRQLLNWVVTYRQAEAGSPVPRREDWNRQGAINDLLPHLAAFSGLPIDLEALVRSSPEFYEYPMVDRDPLPRWTHGRVTLLGDAAHPMYPVGSNGAGQAIVDARILADALVACEHPMAALAAYEAERLPKTAAIVASNRSGGPEGAIDEVERRAPNGFAKLADVIDDGELKAIVAGYAKMAGFAPGQTTNVQTGN
ncbi:MULTISPECIES: flavin-dependent oxidoreductase [unclassified Beijerinckia]|uniref:flavin-dependent oxidoreductase n=1 Tax=unclassified Beijerinckia TaxID=2638183 RepID=UPI000894D30F|nr:MULTISPECIES: flavin-dependent oxidoreductase [unclassified Beijerinckia]MDH7796570.1 2-polyprenyl-6-methoxyphenol hydroxylase-like FAD-dependent oxidoreductase [Beijerinckia sp. GAS462]SEC50739.1 2-polyprenyl-6-methoxyphenol hydroxylase [Beijerinckia sp. 28-YEA-48]